MQKNWLGKSFGCEISFKIDNSKNIDEIKCYTTRPDTLFGMSFIALSVDHPIAKYYENNKEFIKFKDFWTDWKLWLMSKKLNPIEACIRFVNSIEGVNKIILGVNSTSHLEEIFHYYRNQ